MQYHLAQLNIAYMKAPIDDPLLADFVAQLDEINALAEQHQGFIWRLKNESNNATDIQVFPDPHYLVNMSVWDSIENLKNFTYKTAHAGIMRQRKKWFDKINGMHLVLWWIPLGQKPTVQEAKERLEYLTLHGETAHAFTFRNIFLPKF